MIEAVLSWLSGWRLACFIPVLTILLFVIKAVYNVLFHPLRHIPGPKFFAMSHLPYVRHHIDGTTTALLKRLHKQYGEVVRYSPDDVSFISMETALQDIYGFRTGEHKGKLNMNKDLRWYPRPPNDVDPILTASDANHNRIRRSLAHAFSDKALTAEEALLQQYSDLLISQMSSTVSESLEPVDLCAWYDWTTFDVIAALLFGESFGCLDGRKTPRFVQMLLDNNAAQRFRYVSQVYRTDLQVEMDFFNWIKEQTDKRLAKDPEHADFFTHILANNAVGKNISLDELHSNAMTLLVAGTETTATLLSGISYFLCKNPVEYQILKTEIRTLWTNYDDIDVHSALQDAPYLNAVIKEGLRLFAPIAAGFPRKVPAGGDTISGYFIPEGVSVSMSHDAAYTSSRNFKDAEQFVPERWLPDNEEYQHDKWRWMQPFSYGPRNCIGKNLAYAEARLFLAKMIWSFDFELHPSSENWLERGLYKLLRSNPELMVRVTKADDRSRV